MTTIILTIIGILLAAAAALMVIFYGGDAFNAGSVGARANTIQNGGTNFIAAVQLYKADGKPVSAVDSVAALQDASEPANDYLKEFPTLDGIAGTVTVTDGNLTVAGVKNDVCLRINRNLNLAAAPADAEAAEGFKMSCIPAADNATTGAGESTFYAFS